MTHLASLLQRLRRSTSGIAMVEFAFAAPLLLTMLLGSLELSNYILANMRLSQIAITVADNAGRVRTGIDESNIYEVFAGASLIGSSMNFDTNGRIVLSSLEPNGQTGSAAGQMINWQRCYGSLAVSSSYGAQGYGRTTSVMANGMGATGNRITAASGTAVMFVEATYHYTPTIFTLIPGMDRNIRYESAFNVRERTNQNITNTQGLAVKSC